MAAEDVESCSGDEIAFWVKVYVAGADACVRDGAVQGCLDSR